MPYTPEIPCHPTALGAPYHLDALCFNPQKSGQLPKISEGIPQTKKLHVRFLDGLIFFITAFLAETPRFRFI